MLGLQKEDLLLGGATRRGLGFLIVCKLLGNNTVMIVFARSGYAPLGARIAVRLVFSPSRLFGCFFLQNLMILVMLHRRRSYRLRVSVCEGIDWDVVSGVVGRNPASSSGRKCSWTLGGGLAHSRVQLEVSCTMNAEYCLRSRSLCQQAVLGHLCEGHRALGQPCLWLASNTCMVLRISVPHEPRLILFC